MVPALSVPQLVIQTDVYTVPCPDELNFTVFLTLWPWGKLFALWKTQFLYL